LEYLQYFGSANEVFVELKKLAHVKLVGYDGVILRGKSHPLTPPHGGQLIEFVSNTFPNGNSHISKAFSTLFLSSLWVANILITLSVQIKTLGYYLASGTFNPSNYFLTCSLLSRSVVSRILV